MKTPIRDQVPQMNGSSNVKTQMSKQCQNDPMPKRFFFIDKGKNRSFRLDFGFHLNFEH
jgi:hypothetical protein